MNAVITACLAFLATAPFLLVGQPVTGPGYPRVELVYRSSPFDQTCVGWLRAPIKREWVDELTTKIPLLQQEWDGEAKLVLGTLVAETGKPFRQRDMIANLTLCKIPSMSSPLLIAIRGYFEPGHVRYGRKDLLMPEILYELRARNPQAGTRRTTSCRRR